MPLSRFEHLISDPTGRRLSTVFCRLLRFTLMCLLARTKLPAAGDFQLEARLGPEVLTLEIAPSGPKQCLKWALLAVAVSLAPVAKAQPDSTGFLNVSLMGSEIRISVEPSVGFYYRFRGTADLRSQLLDVGMVFGHPPSLIYSPLPGNSMFFFQAEGISVFSPRDSDLDGMDDLYELGQELDPLDSSDAEELSPHIAGLTNLDEYRLRFGLSSAKPQYYSRELSAFNFGAARNDALSREQSVFNFGGSLTLGLLAREITVFNGERPPIPGFRQIYSREHSVFSFGAGFFLTNSREVSVFNGERHPIARFQQVYSRELSAFNLGASRGSVESREVSVFNNIPQ